jgi:EpsI family protein
MKSTAWPPAIVLAIGALLATVGVRAQRSLPLRASLASAVPTRVEGFEGRDLALSPEEVRAVGVTSYLSRVFEHGGDSAAARAGTPAAAPAWFTLYVGYYDRQTSGKTIHSPRNCLPGGGWEPLTYQVATVATSQGPVSVNRYLIQNGRRQALVLYWYQGRGRVAASEYGVKWDLVRDAALRRRSEEALVRILVPIQGSEASAFDLATRVASRMVPTLSAALPG